MVNVYKCGSYRGIKLLEHAMKVLERVIEGRLRKIVKIDNMQFGFMAGRSTIVNASCACRKGVANYSSVFIFKSSISFEYKLILRNL